MYIIQITGEYIQLDQLLKKEGLIQTGGETAMFLSEHKVSLNGIKVFEKRKKNTQRRRTHHRRHRI